MRLSNKVEHSSQRHICVFKINQTFVRILISRLLTVTSLMLILSISKCSENVLTADHVGCAKSEGEHNLGSF